MKTKRINIHLILGVLVIAVYCVNRFIIKPCLYDSESIIAIILKNHFNDFCGSFLFCSYLNILIYKTRADLSFRTLKDYVVLGIICAVFWECISPVLIKKSVSDYLDCIAYVAGTVTYYFAFKALHSSLINKETSS